MPLSQLLRRAALTTAGVLVAGLVTLPMASSSAAPVHPSSHPRSGHHIRYDHARRLAPVVAGTDYLALGDSVAFGYREPTTLPAPDYYDAADFIGYPEDVASALGLSVANLACPGETSASLINPNAQSNGCENSLVDGQKVDEGYRTLYPLHVAYQGSQLAAGVAYLRTHHRTRLVSLMIGANDAFLCEDNTADHCTSPAELAAVVAGIEKNVTIILRTVRHYYRGQIAIVDYYSLSYTNPADEAGAQLLDNAMNTAAKPFHVVVVNGYEAFAAASQYSGGNPCTAGLLTQLSTGGCGVHPTPAGQDVLAQAIEAAIRK
jgi:lysophospholipase L1-like esterase